MSYLTSEKKVEFFKEFGGSETNTGSVDAQIAILSHRINHLTEHLRSNKKDFGTKRALLKMVGRRRRLLNYVAKKDIEAYRALIAKLGLRR
jgi:small subunit ribosomal protein S15